MMHGKINMKNLPALTFMIAKGKILVRDVNYFDSAKPETWLSGVSTYVTLAHEVGLKKG